jgi:hypothetical protein
MSNSIKIKNKKTKFRKNEFSGLTQSFQNYGELAGAMAAKRSEVPAYRDRSAQAAEQLSRAMTRIRTEGYQPDGSYVDRNGIRQSKAYLDNLDTRKAELPGKGIKGQRCNRTACQAEGAYWYNHSTDKHYCGTCADIINAANGPNDEYVRNLGHDLLTLEPEFEDKRAERM